MKKKALSLLLCLLLFAGAAASAVSARDYGCDVAVTANAVYMENLDTGEVICEKNADVQVEPASTTKILATAVAMTLCSDPKNTYVTLADDIWAEFAGLDVSSAGLKAGETVSMYDLFCCMMIPSANEAASAVAEYYGWDYFIGLMNDKAAELGCTNSHFSNPHGVFSENHYTSARDMARITKWALTVPGFYEISQMARYTKAATNMNEETVLATTNYMQDPNSLYYTSYIKGVKTGTTDGAGRCLISTAQKDGTTYLLVVLGGPFADDTRVWPTGGNSAFTETRLLDDWAFANLELGQVTGSGDIVAEIGLKHASRRDTLLLYPEKDLYSVLRKDRPDDAAVTYETDVPDSVSAPITSGQQIGTAKVFFNGEYVGDIALVAREDVPLDRFVLLMDGITSVMTSTAAKIIYVLLFLLVALYLFYMLVVVPRAQKKHRRKKKKSAAPNSSAAARKDGGRR